MLGGTPFSWLITLRPVSSSSSRLACRAMSPPRFLAEHALINSFFREAIFLPQLTGTIQGDFRIAQFLHALIGNFGEPHLYRLCFRAGNELNQAQKSFSVRGISHALLPSSAVIFNP